jgi:transcriptional regulator with XRE-family HTH domain
MTPVKYTLAENFVSVILPGRGVFALDKTHPTFSALTSALKRKQWARIPSLITLADRVSNETHGKVAIRKGVAYYKDKPLKGYLGNKLGELARRGEKVSHLLKFADNLMKNPDPETIPEVMEFLDISHLPITDDGCFLAYKCINSDYTDCHTGRIDNTPGQTPAMPRKNADSSSRALCSSGFHFCALDYIRDGFGATGRRIVMIKVNPRDVVAIPEYKDAKKGRCWLYEVVKELFTIDEAARLQDHPDMLHSVVTLAKERRELLKFVLANSTIKRAIRRREIKKSTIMKQTLARLQKMAAKLPAPQTEPVKPSTVLANNLLKSYRTAAGLTVGQIAKQLKIGYKVAWAMENAENPKQETIDRYLEAIAKLTNVSSRESGLAFPKATQPQDNTADETSYTASEVINEDAELEVAESEPDIYDPDGEDEESGEDYSGEEDEES